MTGGFGFTRVVERVPRPKLRFTVYAMLPYLASGMTAREILTDHPCPTEEDIRAHLGHAVERERQTLVARG